ncbi:6-carboxyhexanoate--CoA ligase [Geoalkalibacter halelectricus]|uniref:6-carboxyhexanoate--CoA ligase n=1 Tax=Geoalkalibacter halelectricus TaxID=2847045 RepID=A0ABY5ZUV4_9BACT|nr:6-carboxyhexanoate--CoA ligase [Geoalkalibacter halelectricus]UWZ80991.1 6-carboxyhexanoate--CoA ligase [Geoalkalibacter halelectricus]
MLAFLPMDEAIYSVRMHAQRAGAHLCGAERLVPQARIEETAATLVRRALAHPRGRAEGLRLAVDLVDKEGVLHGRLPDVTTVRVGDFCSGRALAAQLLGGCGVTQAAARFALDTLAAGAAPDGRSMRGAMLVGAHSGRRLEPDAARGVRVTRMDLSARAEQSLGAALAPYGLDRVQVREALVLAAKVLAAPGVVAELCWSDDPDYLTGYVACAELGYVRITELKPRGDERGGRAFFVDERNLDLQGLCNFLERQVFLADDIGTVHPPREHL